MASTTAQGSSCPRADSFVDRVKSLPVVHDSLSHLHSAVTATSVGRFAYSHANSIASAIYKDSEPLLKKAQPQLMIIDSYANKGLDLVEKRLPIIKTPTDEIIAQARKPADDAYKTVSTTVKTYVDSVNQTVDKRVKTPARHIYTERVEPLVMRVDSNFAPLVDVLENTVHKYVPATMPNGTGVAATPASGESSSQFSRVYGLSRETSSYLLQLSSRQLTDLQQSNALLKQATDSVASLNAKLQATIKEVREKETLSERVHALSNSIIAELDAIQSYVKDNATKFPTAVQHRLQPFTDFVQARYSDIKTEVSKEGVSPVQKARNVVNVTSEQTIPVLQSAITDLQNIIQHYVRIGQKKVDEEKDQHDLVNGTSHGEEKKEQHHGSKKHHSKAKKHAHQVKSH